MMCLDNNNTTSDIVTNNNQIITKAHSTTNLTAINTLCAIDNNKYGSMNFECVSKSKRCVVTG